MVHWWTEGVVGGFAAERRLSEAPVAAAAEYWRCFFRKERINPGPGSPLLGPPVARSLGPVKTPPPYTHYPGPYVPRYS